MKRLIIGLDTSNYRTSVAAVSAEGEILLNARMLLPVAEGQRGLRQSEAVFLHIRQLREVMAPLREIMGTGKLCAVAASVKPRGAEDSYMPVFQVGETMGQGLAAATDVPFFSTSHQAGHIAAAAYGTPLAGASSFLAFHLSGGTTELLLSEEDRLTALGGTLDLHAGQLVDRVGVAMGLPFPAGPALEALALRGNSEGRLRPSLADGDLHCHFSGAETQAQRLLGSGEEAPEDIAREVYDVLAGTVARMLRAGRRQTGQTRALLAGGVSASGLFRRLLTERLDGGVEVFFGREDLSGDNAVGVALIGAQRYLEMKGMEA